MRSGSASTVENITLARESEVDTLMLTEAEIAVLSPVVRAIYSVWCEEAERDGEGVIIDELLVVKKLAKALTPQPGCGVPCYPSKCHPLITAEKGWKDAIETGIATVQQVTTERDAVIKVGKAAIEALEECQVERDDALEKLAILHHKVNSWLFQFGSYHSEPDKARERVDFRIQHFRSEIAVQTTYIKGLKDECDALRAKVNEMEYEHAVWEKHSLTQIVEERDDLRKKLEEAKELLSDAAWDHLVGKHGWSYSDDWRRGRGK